MPARLLGHGGLLVIDVAHDTHTMAEAPRGAEERVCVHPGCGQWGCFGLERIRGASGYWCKEHLPDDYWAPPPVN